MLVFRQSLQLWLFQWDLQLSNRWPKLVILRSAHANGLSLQVTSLDCSCFTQIVDIVFHSGKLLFISSHVYSELFFVSQFTFHLAWILQIWESLGMVLLKLRNLWQLLFHGFLASSGGQTATRRLLFYVKFLCLRVLYALRITIILSQIIFIFVPLKFKSALFDYWWSL